MEEAKPGVPDNKNLIINYLPQTLSDELFYEMFSSIGAIQSCRIMRNMQTGYSFGYGFVQYVNPADADKAIASLDGHALLNKKIKVSFARPPGQDIKDTNLYIHNLPRNIDESYVTNMFAPFGKIIQSRLLLDKITNLPRGVAFVRYSKRDEAMAAIEALNHTIPEGGTLSLNVKVAEDYSKTKQMYMAQYVASQGPAAGMPSHMGFPAGGRGGGRGGQFRGGRGRARGGPRMGGPGPASAAAAAPAAGFPGARPLMAPAGGYMDTQTPAPPGTGYDPSAAAAGQYSDYTASSGDYSGGYSGHGGAVAGDYSADYGGDYSGYTGGYGTAPGMADYYGAGGDAAAYAGGYSGAAAARGQNRRGSRGGTIKAMPFKTNNRFNPMGF